MMTPRSHATVPPPRRADGHLTADEVRPDVDTLVRDEIVQLLQKFYDAGCVHCADTLPLRIAFEPEAEQVRLWDETSGAYDVVFPQAKFVEMVRHSRMPPSATLIRIWLGTVYFDTHVYKWARIE
jgi:hypothetical protein